MNAPTTHAGFQFSALQIQLEKEASPVLQLMRYLPLREKMLTQFLISAQVTSVIFFLWQKAGLVGKNQMLTGFPFSGLYHASKSCTIGSEELGSAATCQALKRCPIHCRNGKVEQVTDLLPPNSFGLLLKNRHIMNPKSGGNGSSREQSGSIKLLSLGALK